MSLVVVNVEAAVYHVGRYLMVVRGDEEEYGAGHLAFPGGTVDFTDMPDILEQTAVREVLEETGVQVTGANYVESHAFTAPDGAHVVDIVFLCRYQSETPTIVDPGEVAALQWMTAAEILKHPASQPWVAPSLKLVERKRKDLGW